MIEIKKINSNENDFLKILENHTRKRIKNTSGVKERVKNIISEVRNYGDDALLRFSKEFDNFDVSEPKEFEISKKEFSESLPKISKKELYFYQHVLYTEHKRECLMNLLQLTLCPSMPLQKFKQKNIYKIQVQ